MKRVYMAGRGAMLGQALHEKFDPRYLARPLQVESVLGTPLLMAQLLHSHKISWASNYGSQQLVGPGVPLLANLSGAFMLQALAGVYAVIWRRRERPRATPPDQAIAVLALMTFGQVLSPCTSSGS